MNDVPLSVLAILVSLGSLVVAFLSYRHAIVESVRPMLVFYRTERGWLLHNVGSGAAVYIIVVASIPRAIPGSRWKEPREVSALGRDQTLALGVYHDRLYDVAASYTDVSGRWYSTVYEDDRNWMSKGRLLPEWPRDEVVHSWDQFPANSRNA